MTATQVLGAAWTRILYHGARPDGRISILLNYEGICWYLLTRVFMFLWLGLVKSRKTDIKYVAGQ